MGFIRDTQPRFEQFKREGRDPILVPSYLRQCLHSPQNYESVIQGLGIISLNGNNTTDFQVDPKKTTEAHSLIAERSPRLMAILATEKLYMRQGTSLRFSPVSLDAKLTWSPDDYVLGRYAARLYAAQSGICREEHFSHSIELAAKKQEVIPFYKQKSVELATGQIDDPFVGVEVFLLDELNTLKERKKPKKKKRKPKVLDDPSDV